MIRCPECGVEVQPDWDWCHACGWDPEGLKPAAPPAAPPPPASASAPPPPTAAPARPGSVPPEPAPFGPGPAATDLPSFGPGPSTAPGSRPATPTGPPPGAPRPGWSPPEWSTPPGGPPGAGGPPPGYGYGHPPGPPAYAPAGANTGATVAKVLLGIGGAAVVLLAVCVLAVTFLGTAASSKFSSIQVSVDELDPNGSWTTWTAPDGSFQVDFPATPVVRDVPPTSPADAGGKVVGADAPGAGYVLAYADLAPGFVVTDPEAMLDTAIQTGVTSAGITVTAQDSSTFSGYPARTFAGTATMNGITGDVAGVAFATSDRLYVLYALGDGDVEGAAFFDSFLLR